MGMALVVLKGFLSGLAKIPLWVYPVALLVFWGWNANRHARVEKERAAIALQQASAATAAADQFKEQRDEVQRISVERTKAAEAQAAQAKKDRAIATAANAAAERVLKRTADLVAEGRSSSASSPVPGGSPVELLGGAFTSCVAAYRELGEDAAEAVRRGERCVREYEALGKRGPAP